MKNRKGFTLIELLLVMVIIAILMSIVLIAINPAGQTAQANNVKRSAQVNTILNGVWQYALDNDGLIPTSIPVGAAAAAEIGDDVAGGEIDLCTELVTGGYIAAMPADPTSGAYTDCATYNTGYTIYQDANGKVTVAAPNAQDGEIISVTR